MAKWADKIKGSEFEKHVAKLLEEDGWSVSCNGENKDVKDGGIDLIAKKQGTTVIIQCKYRSNPNWLINEDKINQLYGALNAYRHENPNEQSTAVFITTCQYSTEAKKKAKIHGIELIDKNTINLNFKPTV